MADPTVTDVFNQLVLVNGKLDQVEVNTSMITTLNASINAGFNDTVNALNVLTQVNIEAVKLLYHQTQQADTMICALEQISKNTCEILTQVTIQTSLQTRLREDMEALRYMTESAQPEAALESQRLAKLRAEIERCCPPDPQEPACKYEPCERPEPVKEPRLPEIDDKDDNPEGPR
jgi:outer membrane murein-binding lipoprotein Lpp